MGEVVFDISMSLDGSTTGCSTARPPQTEVLDEVCAPTGAIIVGKRIFDLGVGPWGDPPPFHMPVFLVTHEAPERWSSRAVPRTPS